MAILRLFVSIEIPGDLRERISDIQERLSIAGKSIRWTRREAIHITLNFLGSVEDKRVSKIALCLGKATDSIQPFKIDIKGLGMFPDNQRPRVIWIGVTTGAIPLVRLQRCFEKSLKNVGFQPERRSFTPHLTLGRVKSFSDKKSIVETIHKYQNEKAGIFLVDKVQLMKSDLNPSGAEYSVVEKIGLNKKF